VILTLKIEALVLEFEAGAAGKKRRSGFPALVPKLRRAFPGTDSHVAEHIRGDEQFGSTNAKRLKADVLAG
jgi:hypothetical protein